MLTRTAISEGMMHARKADEIFRRVCEKLEAACGEVECLAPAVTIAVVDEAGVLLALERRCGRRRGWR